MTLPSEHCHTNKRVFKIMFPLQWIQYRFVQINVDLQCRNYICNIPYFRRWILKILFVLNHIRTNVDWNYTCNIHIQKLIPFVWTCLFGFCMPHSTVPSTLYMYMYLDWQYSYYLCSMEINHVNWILYLCKWVLKIILVEEHWLIFVWLILIKT